MSLELHFASGWGEVHFASINFFFFSRGDIRSISALVS
jgi:hypothetical protein